MGDSLGISSRDLAGRGGGSSLLGDRGDESGDFSWFGGGNAEIKEQMLSNVAKKSMYD